MDIAIALPPRTAEGRARFHSMRLDAPTFRAIECAAVKMTKRRGVPVSRVEIVRMALRAFLFTHPDLECDSEGGAA